MCTHKGEATINKNHINKGQIHGGSHGKVKRDDMMDGESTEGLHGVGSCASDEKPSDCNKLYIQIQLLISEQVQVAQGHFKKKQKTGDAGD